jgi:hypothetical protein
LSMLGMIAAGAGASTAATAAENLAAGI